MGDVQNRIEKDELFLDSAIIAHGFAPYLRDYHVIIDVPAAKPDGSGSYVEGRYLYRFTHCPQVRVDTVLDGEAWQRAWSDDFIDYNTWERAGNPEGFVWGVNYADAYPGLRYVSKSVIAGEWANRVGRPMHEIAIETNTFVLSLICHDYDIERLAKGDAASGVLSDLETGQPLPTTGHEHTVIPIPPSASPSD